MPGATHHALEGSFCSSTGAWAGNPKGVINCGAVLSTQRGRLQTDRRIPALESNEPGPTNAGVRCNFSCRTYFLPRSYRIRRMAARHACDISSRPNGESTRGIQRCLMMNPPLRYPSRSRAQNQIRKWIRSRLRNQSRRNSRLRSPKGRTASPPRTKEPPGQYST